MTTNPGLTISTIREALAATVRNGIDRQTTVRAYPPLPTGTSPNILVSADADYVDYWLTMGALGLAAVRFVLELDPGGTDVESMHRRIDDYLSVGQGNESSVVDAVMADGASLGLDNCVAQLGAATLTFDEAVGRPLASLPVTVTINKRSAVA